MIGSIPKNGRERVEVALADFKGHAYLDLRVYFSPDDGETWKPSAKGCTVRPHQIGDLIRLLTLAEADARGRGLIGGDDDGRH